jgi:hypothetical protein
VGPSAAVVVEGGQRESDRGEDADDEKNGESTGSGLLPAPVRAQPRSVP